MSKNQLKNNNVGRGFDRITFFYDAMTCITSFNYINKSQLAFLSKLSTQSTCLILGGGTGYFLQKLVEENKTIHVTYVDVSEKMIEYAQKRIKKNIPDALHRVTFICKDIEAFECANYDSIVCNYFLDLFDDRSIARFIQLYKKQLNQNGILYITDFSMPEDKIVAWTTKIGLKVLYKFFKWTTQLATKELSDIDTIISDAGFNAVHSKSFLKGILKCVVYKCR